MLKRILLTAGLLLLLAFNPAGVEAGKLKVWKVETAEGYAAAELNGAAVTDQGAVRLARDLQPLQTDRPLGVARVWDVVEDSGGNLILATGGGGEILRVAPGGEVSVLYRGDDVEILSLAAGPEGSVYAGTGPSGTVLRVAPDGTVAVLRQLPSAYVWGLAYDQTAGALFAATGPEGRVYRIRPGGETDLFYQTRQEHVLCVATDGKGTVYAGTDRKGLVYRIDPTGKGYVLFQAPQSEVRRIQVTPEALYVGTTAPTDRTAVVSEKLKSPAAVASSPLPSGSRPASAGAEPGAEAGPDAAVSTGSGDGGEKSKSADRPQSASAPSVPETGENSVYRLGFDGSVRELFREKALIQSLRLHGDRLYVGTGVRGRLFEVDPATRERSEVARLDQGVIHQIVERADGSLLVAAGDPGRIYTLRERYVGSGTVTSEVFDAGLISRWGSFSWRADRPEGTSLTVALRGGNVSEPDDTWTDWSAEYADPAGAAAALPPSRFAQYRVTLKTSDPSATPVLRSVRFRYATVNLAPELTSLETPDFDAEPAKEPKKVKLKWATTDPNEDALTYDLYVRKDGWNEWVRVAEALAKTEYEWDTTAMPEGNYLVKVVADDSPDNPPASALRSERVGGPVLVAHEPPAVSVKVTGIDGERVTVAATATAPVARIAAASYSLNGGDWVDIFPADGLSDSRSERYEIRTGPVEPGAYVMVVRVRDVAGNVGSAEAVFTVRRK